MTQEAQTTQFKNITRFTKDELLVALHEISKKRELFADSKCGFDAYLTICDLDEALNEPT